MHAKSLIRRIIRAKAPAGTSLDPDSFIRSLSKLFLKREPEPEMMELNRRFLLEGGDPGQLVENFFRSEECRTLYSNEGPKFFNEDSQNGEIAILAEYMMHLPVKHRIIVDVGARGPRYSNAYDLVTKLKWRGILIEANPNVIPDLEMGFAGADVDIINVAISNYEGEAEFFVADHPDVSSLSEDHVRMWGTPPVSTCRVPVRRLGAVLSEHDVPHDFDLLSLDIEGEDIRSLNDLIDNSSYCPRWVIIEASWDFQYRSLYDLEFSDRVREIYHIVAQNNVNMILELKDPSATRPAMMAPR